MYILFYLCLLCFLWFLCMSFTTYTETYQDKPKIIHLVLYSKDPVYDRMLAITRAYYNKHKNITTIYYTYTEDIPDNYMYDKNNNMLYIKGKETMIPGVLDKTIKAFKFVINEINDNFDYLIRSNISTIVDFSKLSNHLLKNPIDYGTSFINTIYKGYRNKFYGINDDRFGQLSYPSGTSIIMSHRLFTEFMKYVDRIDYSVIDDVSIGFLIKTYLPQYHLYDYNNDNNDNKHDKIFFRNRKDNRMDDIQTMENIIKSIE